MNLVRRLVLPAVLLIPIAGLGACSDDGGGPLTTRQINDAVESACTDAVDARLDDDGASDSDAFLHAITDGDTETAIEAARYNIDAVSDFADAIDRISADSDEDQEVLDSMVAALRDRSQGWADRLEALESGEIELDEDGPSIEILGIGRDALDLWYDGVEYFDVSESDCGLAAT